MECKYPGTSEPCEGYREVEAELLVSRQENEMLKEVLAEAEAALEKVGKWLSAALDDDICQEFRDDIEFYFAGMSDLEALAAIEEMEKGKSKIIPDDICGLCYHPKTESNSCTRPDCNLGGEHG